MFGIAVLIGLGLLWVATQGKSGPGSSIPVEPGVIPEQEMALLVQSGGRPAYIPEARPLVIQRLKTLRVDGTPIAPDGSIVKLVDEAKLVDPSYSAYEYAKAAHGQGYNIWVSPTLMGAIQDRILATTTQAAPNPPPTLPVALLVSFADPWPPDMSGTAPPTPDNAPSALG